MPRPWALPFTVPGGVFRQTCQLLPSYHTNYHNDQRGCLLALAASRPLYYLLATAYFAVIDIATACHFGCILDECENHSMLVILSNLDND